MGNRSLISLSAFALLLFVPAVAMKSVFAEQLIMATGRGGDSADFFVFDKNSGLEIKTLAEDTATLSGIDFSAEGNMIFSASGQVSDEDPGFGLISFLINQGTPASLIDAYEDFQDFYCHDISFAPDGTLYCTLKTVVQENGQDVERVGLYEIDLELGLTTLIGTSEENSSGNAIAVDSDGTIFFGNNIGLFTLNPQTGASTFIGNWNVAGYNDCKPGGMDFDLSETLYGAF